MWMRHARDVISVHTDVTEEKQDNGALNERVMSDWRICDREPHAGAHAQFLTRLIELSVTTIGKPLMVTTYPWDCEPGAISDRQLQRRDENWGVRIVRRIVGAHVAFYDKDLDLRDGQTIWDDSQALEAAAELLRLHTKHLDEWVKGVPNALKTKRQNGGSPYSIDGSSLEIEQFAPLWLQRQRLLIELTYHNLCLNLYRPLISLVSAPSPSLSVEEIAVLCVSHAIAYTKITHQVLSSTSILDGWHEVFQWQWKYANFQIHSILYYPRPVSNTMSPVQIDC
ncbi:hypothetical protein EAF04_008764 [Stromatinia cepivora]|nr:hypothetical protein EAF04_008764 [Stromatinia cepivora]